MGTQGLPGGVAAERWIRLERSFRAPTDRVSWPVLTEEIARCC
jgi:hypothetical protein